MFPRAGTKCARSVLFSRFYTELQDRSCAIIIAIQGKAAVD